MQTTIIDTVVYRDLFKWAALSPVALFSDRPTYTLFNWLICPVLRTNLACFTDQPSLMAYFWNINVFHTAILPQY